MRTISEQLYDAVCEGDLKGARDALVRGADVNVMLGHKTPLMEACGNRNNFSLPIVKLLLENGARVDERNDFGETPLIFLGKAGNCSEQVLNLLLDAGADINAFDNHKKATFLMNAAGHLTPEILELAVWRGANINQENEWGNTALYYAIRTGSSFTIDIADAFARCGAKFGIRDQDRRGLAEFTDNHTAFRIYVGFSELGKKKIARYFFNVLQKNFAEAAPENKGILALTRLALMYPEADSKLEEEIGRDLSESFLPLLEYFPDASVSFWTNVLNVLSREHGKSEKLKKYYSYHAKKMTKVLSAVFDHSPDSAIRFINSRLGGDILEKWENDEVPGARDLNEDIFTLFRDRVGGKNILESGYIL